MTLIEAGPGKTGAEHHRQQHGATLAAELVAIPDDIREIDPESLDLSTETEDSQHAETIRNGQARLAPQIHHLWGEMEVAKASGDTNSYNTLNTERNELIQQYLRLTESADQQSVPIADDQPEPQNAAPSEAKRPRTMEERIKAASDAYNKEFPVSDSPAAPPQPIPPEVTSRARDKIESARHALAMVREKARMGPAERKHHNATAAQHHEESDRKQAAGVASFEANVAPYTAAIEEYDKTWDEAHTENEARDALAAAQQQEELAREHAAKVASFEANQAPYAAALAAETERAAQTAKFEANQASYTAALAAEAKAEERKQLEAHDKYLDEAYAENQKFDKAKAAQEKADAKQYQDDLERAKAIDQANNAREAAKARVEEEARLTALAEERLDDVPSFKDYVKEKQAEARRPFDLQIAKLMKQRDALAALTSKRLSKKAMLEDIDDQITELQLQAQKAEKKAKKAVKAERKALNAEVTEQSGEVLDFISSDKSGNYVYKPKRSEDPDKTLVVAGSIGELVGKQTEADGQPFQVDEYRLGDTHMQRLVYKTKEDDMLVVEDWDKTAGILKRQTIMKGSDLLIPDYQNDGLGRIRSRRRQKSGNYKFVLNDQKYAETGFIKESQVAGDSDTSYDVGSFSYASRLKRSGVAAGGAYELSAGTHKLTRNKGFIALLTESIENQRQKK